MTISFETERLRVVEVSGQLALTKRSFLLEQIPKILTPLVVKNLPPYFHGITSSDLAGAWLDRMLSESRLLQVRTKTHELIGFLFAYVENESDAHIGYLLTEKYWAKGWRVNYCKVLSRKWLNLSRGQSLLVVLKYLM